MDPLGLRKYQKQFQAPFVNQKSDWSGKPTQEHVGTVGNVQNTPSSNIDQAQPQNPGELMVETISYNIASEMDQMNQDQQVNVVLLPSCDLVKQIQTHNTAEVDQVDGQFSIVNPDINCNQPQSECLQKLTQAISFQNNDDNRLYQPQDECESTNKQDDVRNYPDPIQDHMDYTNKGIPMQGLLPSSELTKQAVAPNKEIAKEVFMPSSEMSKKALITNCEMAKQAQVTQVPSIEMAKQVQTANNRESLNQTPNINQPKQLIFARKTVPDIHVVSSIRSSSEQEPDGCGPKRPFVCDVCGATFQKKNKLNEHALKHEKISCKYCGKQYTSYSSLRFHSESQHSSKTFPCEKCGSAFSGKVALYQHSKSSACENEKNRAKNFYCDFCGNGYKTKKALKVHLKKHPVDSDSE